MISLEVYKKILNNGLLLDHYMVMCNIRDGKEMPKSRRIDGFINLLEKKGYIEDGVLTDLAFDIIDIHPVIVVGKEDIETPKFDFVGWSTSLHEKCVNKIIELTGKRQVISKIKNSGAGYRFLDGIQDFSTRLYKCIERYKLKDMDIVEKAILNHIDNCHSSGNWFPLMKYYITKQGEGSPMVTDIENGIDIQKKDEKSTQKFV